MFSSRLVILISIFLLAGCGLWATRPKEEMGQAAAAFMAAKDAKADICAPQQYRKSEFYYLKAKSSYRRKYFNKAKQYALLVQRFAEEAEYVSRRKEAIGETCGGHEAPPTQVQDVVAPTENANSSAEKAAPPFPPEKE